MKAGLIGRVLGHSFSPEIHQRIGGYEYALYPLEADQVERFVRTCDLDGFNVTIPYKQTVLPFMSELSPTAQKIGSVNTVVCGPDGRRYGDNTDYDGFLHLLGTDGARLRGKKALVLGSGGAAKAVRVALEGAGIRVVIISRRGENNYENLERHRDAELLVNATPVGMFPQNDASPLDLTRLPGLSLALDLIYNPLRTRLLCQAEEMGIPARNGLAMLTAQAVKAAERFTGRVYPGNLADEIAAAITARLQNVVIIGMPGVGKSTVGRLLAQATGREAWDTDDMILSMTGRTPAQIIREDGEKVFRAAETRALAEATRATGRVILTGGGIVTRPENRALIRQNGFCVYLVRSLADLDTQDRPLSQTRGLAALLKERESLYKGWSDVEIWNDTPQSAVGKIREALKI